MKNQFYMVLPSDSSMSYFPENTATHFTTQLPHEVHLNGNWAVALTEFQFSRNFLQIQRGDDAYIGFILGKPTEMEDFEIRAIQHGLYDKIKDIIDALNNVPIISKHLLFEINDRGYAVVRLSCNQTDCTVDVHRFRLSKKLESILGFDHSILGDGYYEITRYGLVISHRPASLTRALPDKMFIYCDICEPYITGDVQTSLLRVVPCDNSQYIYGSMHTVSFASANYIPLLHMSFRTIEIDIRDTLGGSIPFESGPLNVTLHFKRLE